MEQRKQATTTLEAEGSIDILNWLARAVMENNEEVASILPAKTEPVDFDLLQYVDCPDDDANENILNQSIIDELVLSSEDLSSCPFTIDSSNDTENCSANALSTVPLNIDLVECPASPSCKSQEIIDYDVEHSSYPSISASPIFDDTMEEPNWLTSWDSL